MPLVSRAEASFSLLPVTKYRISRNGMCQIIQVSFSLPLLIPSTPRVSVEALNGSACMSGRSAKAVHVQSIVVPVAFLLFVPVPLIQIIFSVPALSYSP